jgi:hypothetical protein
MEINVTENINNITISVSEDGENVSLIVTPIISSISFTVSEVGQKGDTGNDSSILTKVSGESIPSHTPVAVVNNLAYKLDSSNASHKFAYVGFSTNGSSLGQNCIIRQFGEVELIGWGLTPNQHYLVGVGGSLIIENNSPTNFTKVVGYATNSNTIKIIKDFTTINK